MEFCDYMNSLPDLRIETIRRLAKECRVTVNTVYRWISGEFTPDPLKRKMIAETLDIPEEELFPLSNVPQNG